MRHAWAAKLLSCWSDMRKCHCNATTFWFVAWAMANLIGDIAMLHLSVRNCCWNPHRTAFQPHGIAAARSKNKTIDSRCHLGKVNVFLAAGTNNTLHSGCCPWQPSSLAKKLIWIYNNINEKLESKSNSLHAVYKCCCQKQNKKLCFTFCPLTDWPVFSMSTTTTSWIWGRASGIWIPLPKNISGYTTISTKSSNPRRTALRLYVTAAPKSNGKSWWHLRLTE